MPMICKSFLVLIFAALALTLAGCEGEGSQQASERPAPEVVVEKVESQPVVLSSTLSGRTAAYQVAEVRPQVDGIILERLFKEGDAVTAGQPLYQIDQAPYEAAYKSAAAALSRAEAFAVAATNREKRVAELTKSKNVSQQSSDDTIAASKQAKADVAAAEAAATSARIRLERTTITAPIAGTIGRSFVTTGALVTDGQSRELAIINALDPIYVDVVQSSTELLRWKRMRKNGEIESGEGKSFGVKLTLEDNSIYEHEGELELTEVSVNPQTGSVTLRAIFPNPEHLLLPGMFVRAEIVEGVRKNAILISQTAVTRNAQGEGIAYVVDVENRAQMRTVITDRAIGNQWLIVSGLEPGERVVVEGFQRFRPGNTVSPIETVRTAKASSDGTKSETAKNVIE